MMKIINPYNNEFEFWATTERNVDLDTISLSALLKLVDEYNEINNLI